jgi:hypothetical protein
MLPASITVGLHERHEVSVDHCNTAAPALPGAGSNDSRFDIWFRYPEEQPLWEASDSTRNVSLSAAL